MQRVRVGLTGLAFVFLAVLLAAVFTSRSADEAPITPNLIEHQQAGMPPMPDEMEQSEPAEPLAELGVAPGKDDSNLAAPDGSPPSAPPQN